MQDKYMYKYYKYKFKYTNIKNKYKNISYPYKVYLKYITSLQLYNLSSSIIQ